jgi:hypothetical protein
MPLANCTERRKAERVPEPVQYGNRHSDPIRRFVPTPHGITLQLLGKTVRLETNSEKILDLALQFFASYPQMSQGDPDLTWRIVSEPDGLPTPGAPTSGFADADLSFVNIGQRSFLAVDAESRSGIAFLAEGFAEVSEPRFTMRPPFEFLLYMTASSLGLIILSAACVAFEGKGVLLLGEPNSGKTTASYVSAMRGMELFADHVVFLDSAGSGVRAWGDPLPVMFRPETLHFFPELRGQVRELSYGGVGFCFFDKSKLQSPQAHSVVPLCTVFLERAVSPTPRLTPMLKSELLQYLPASMLFKEGERFKSQRGTAFDRLSELPSYRLSYGEDPATAATLVCDLLVSAR